MDVPKNRIILQLLEASHGNVNNIHPPSISSAPPEPNPPSYNSNQRYSNPQTSSYSAPTLPYPTMSMPSYSNVPYPTRTPPNPYQNISNPYPSSMRNDYPPAVPSTIRNGYPPAVPRRPAPMPPSSNSQSNQRTQ